MKKRIIALQIVLILLLNMVLPSVNLAVDEQTDADYLISSKEELIAFANEVNGGNSFSGKTVQLMADIDLNGEEWTPIGNAYSNKFRGSFDGDNHTVSNFKINSTSAYVGFFGFAELSGGYIKNLTIKNGTINASCDSVHSQQIVGGIVASSGEVLDKPGNISNCHNVNVNINASETSRVGGVCGISTGNITIENCSNTGAITIVDNIYGTNTGGIVGEMSVETKVIGCFNSGNISDLHSNTNSSDFLGTGGLVGIITSGTGMTPMVPCVEFCYNTANISSNISAGGIVGKTMVLQETSIVNSYNVGNITSNESYGGGGIIGSNGDEHENNDEFVGTSIENCYYLSGTANRGYGFSVSNVTIGIYEKSSDDMKTQAFVNLLNQNQIYFKLDEKGENNGYPVLEQGFVNIKFEDVNLYNNIVNILEDKISSKDDDKQVIIVSEIELKTIQKLELAEKQITDISGIEKFTNLQELQIYSNSIEDISVLQDNETLRIINLNNNQLSDDDMQIFSTMPNLEILGIAHNKSITKIGELSKATNLLELNAINNEISDLVGIEKLTNLQELYLSGNKIEDISLIPEIATVELKNQNVDKLIKGDKRDELLITLPEILEQALNADSPYYSDEGLELVNVTIENEKIKLKPYTVAKNGGSIKIKSGILQDSYINFISLCTEYQSDLTSEENFKIYGIDLDLDSNGEINEEDAELIKKWYENGELTEEQQQKVSKMDLNMDGKITGRDYRRFLNYINKSSNYLLTAPIEIGEKVNTNVIVGIITNRQFSSPGVESVLEGFNMVFEQNGEYEYFDEDPILAVVDFIDKDAPEYEIRYSTTEPTSGDVTVTITANEELMNIYQIEDIQPEEEAEETEEEEKYNPWILSENKKVLTKTYTENAEEELEIIDLANNRTTIQIKVENIMKGEPLPAELIFTYEDGEEYFQGEWTNQNVKVKIDEESIYEGFTAKYSIDGQGEYTQEQIISQEGEHSIVLTTTDQAGNISNEEYIVLIDKTNPEVGNIIAKEESSSGQSVANNSTTAKNLYISVQDGNDTLSGHQKTVYTINGGEEQTESQILRNEGTYNIKVITYDEAGNYSENSYTYTIDKGAPKATVTYTQNANKTVTATITANKELQPVDGWTLSNDRLSMTKIYSINKQETVEISDLLGNTTTVIVNIQGIENTEFLADVDYSTTKPTKDGVIVTITSNKQMKQLSGFTLSQDKMTQSKTYLNNVQEQIIVQDLNNNQVILNISISNIDRQAPSATITYSTKQITNQDVTVTIQADEKVQNISGWNQTSDLKKLVKIYSQNTNETINLTDLAGNVTQIPIVISNINKEDLQIQTSYSTKNVTNQNVTVTLSSNIPLKVLSGWTLSQDNMKLTKEYTKNTTEKIEVQSQLGHKQNVTVDIKNIDKIAPNATVTYSTTEKTTKPVTVIITSNEKIQEVTGWERNTEQNTLTKTYTENTKENIVISDLAGNQTSVTIDVNQIEKEIQSPYYDITEDGYILGITPDTTKEEFISKLGYEAEMENTQIVKTGMNVKIEGRTYTLVVTGDINQDGCMDIQDLSKLLLHLGEYEDTILTGVQLMAADVNCDGKTDLMDLSKMCMVIAGAMEI